jgi:hypothetical protein
MTAQTAEELAAQIEQEQLEAKKAEVRFRWNPCPTPLPDGANYLQSR